MALFLVRHAHARDRSGWSFDDLERPLDEQGQTQANAITKYFAERPVRGVWSSQAVRCIDTVTGVAEGHQLDIVKKPELTEGARANDLLELLREEAARDGDLVLCSHGDLIPDVLTRLLRDGMSAVGPRGCVKGSVWELESRGRDITRGIYTATP